MNAAMGKLAEKLGIDHARLPREELAEVVCEKALKRIAQLEELHADLLHAFEETPEVFADTVWCRNHFTTLYEAALYCRLDMIEKPDIHEQIGMGV